MAKSNRIIVFDTETTGLTLHPEAPLEKQPKIIEFAAAILENGLVVQEETFLVNPQEKLSEEIMRITGIKDVDVQDQMIFEQYVPLLTRLFGSCDHVMAHNLPFDKQMIANDLKRCSDKWLFNIFPWPKQETCTVGLYRELWGYNPKLTQIYEDILHKPLAQTHRALDDVKALVEIIQEEELWQLG